MTGISLHMQCAMASDWEPILRHWNLERFFKVEENTFVIQRTGLLVALQFFYSAGVVTHDRRIGSWTQSYDFSIYNYNASAVEE
jgi:hypothetical protein